MPVLVLSLFSPSEVRASCGDYVHLDSGGANVDSAMGTDRQPAPANPQTPCVHCPGKTPAVPPSPFSVSAPTTSSDLISSSVLSADPLDFYTQSKFEVAAIAFIVRLPIFHPPKI
jgi:hypothetical protein